MHNTIRLFHALLLLVLALRQQTPTQQANTIMPFAHIKHVTAIHYTRSYGVLQGLTLLPSAPPSALLPAAWPAFLAASRAFSARNFSP